MDKDESLKYSRRRELALERERPGKDGGHSRWRRIGVLVRGRTSTGTHCLVRSREVDRQLYGLIRIRSHRTSRQRRPSRRRSGHAPFLVTDQPDSCKAAIAEFVQDDEPIGDAVTRLNRAKAAWAVHVWVLGIDFPAHLV